jgi:GNAT superfamily N-acetyltransferase
MKITLKKATLEDREQCLSIEKAAMNDLCYLNVVWDYFNKTIGDLTCAYVDGVMAGIGKFTILHDGSAWLETLRVDPKYQGLGVGKEIYKNYFSQAKKYKCKSMGMYTSVDGVISAGLASKFLFTKALNFRGYNLTEFTENKKKCDFILADYQRSVELIMPLADEYHNYIVSNRTFYRINTDTIKGFALEGKVFCDTQNSNFIICGARFQPLLSLHISMMGGDYVSCLEFAKAYAHSQNIDKITFTIPLENPKLEKFLIDSGFKCEPSDLITMEIIL